MARLGLGRRWQCTFANDFDPKKVDSYRENFPRESRFIARDIAEIRATELPGTADLAWCSFPCQDISQAGERRGLQTPARQWLQTSNMRNEGQRRFFRQWYLPLTTFLKLRRWAAERRICINHR